MRLTDLNPRWVGASGKVIGSADKLMPERHGVGVEFDCPCGAPDSPLYVPFANPLDGGPQYGLKGWQRTGDTFETLTLSPSILRTYSVCGCQWHGWVIDGEVRT